MAQLYPYSTIWEKNIVSIINIYGSRSIFLLFYDNQDNESESQEIEICISGPILTHMEHQSLYGTMISILHNMGETYCGNYSYLWSYIHLTTILSSPRHCI